MPRFKVLCLWDHTLGPQVLGRLPQIAHVDWHPPNRELLLTQIHQYDAYLASLYVRLDREMIQLASRLKIVATPTTGVDHIDVEALHQRGIVIQSIATDFQILNQFTCTAELAWGLLIACVRRIPAAFAAVCAGQWARDRFRGHQLSGKTLGILGLGRLGKIVAQYGQAFRMRVIGCDLSQIDVPGVQQVDFDTLLHESDVISIHIHLTPKNRHLIARPQFDKMKPGVVLVNTSRGAIINEEDFLAALESGQVAAAGLDVIDGEWRTDLPDHPLIRYARTHENLVITPRVGGSTVESQAIALQWTADKLASALENLPQT